MRKLQEKVSGLDNKDLENLYNTIEAIHPRLSELVNKYDKLDDDKKEKVDEFIRNNMSFLKNAQDISKTLNSLKFSFI